MKATKINDSDIAEMKISSLPTRPTAPEAYGGKGYTSVEMKAAFDRLPLYIIEKYNALLEDIAASGEDSLSGAIPTGITDGHTLSKLFSDIAEGALLGYIPFGDTTLSAFLADLRADLDAVINRLGGV